MAPLNIRTRTKTCVASCDKNEKRPFGRYGLPFSGVVRSGPRVLEGSFQGLLKIPGLRILFRLLWFWESKKGHVFFLEGPPSDDWFVALSPGFL